VGWGGLRCRSVRGGIGWGCWLVGCGDFVGAAEVCGQVGFSEAGDFFSRRWAACGGGGFVWLVDVGRGLVGVVGELADHFVLVEIEADVADVADGSVEGAENEFSALEFQGAAKQSVDDFHKGGLDGFGVLEQGGAEDAELGKRTERSMRWWK
jgi:hypothetical protein